MVCFFFSKIKCDLVCNYGNVCPEMHKTLPLWEKVAAARRFQDYLDKMISWPHILSRSHELICSGHNKTSLSEPNMSRSNCFVRLFGDHLLFPVDDLWPTSCTIWISALWILNIEFDVPNFFFILKTWSCIFKNGIFAVKEFRTKNLLFENTCLCKKLP